MNEPRGEKRMEKLQELPLLLDAYGALLTEKQRQALSLCYEEDCSLSEIAALHASSRQAAHNLIERGEAQLHEYEAALHLAENNRRRAALLAALQSFAAEAALSAGDRSRLQPLLQELAACC